jgi:hypothetical protein
MADLQRDVRFFRLLTMGRMSPDKINIFEVCQCNPVAQFHMMSGYDDVLNSKIQ